MKKKLGFIILLIIMLALIGAYFIPRLRPVNFKEKYSIVQAESLLIQYRTLPVLLDKEHKAVDFDQEFDGKQAQEIFDLLFEKNYLYRGQGKGNSSAGERIEVLTLFFFVEMENGEKGHIRYTISSRGNIAVSIDLTEYTGEKAYALHAENAENLYQKTFDLIQSFKT